MTISGMLGATMVAGAPTAKQGTPKAGSSPRPNMGSSPSRAPGPPTKPQ